MYFLDSRKTLISVSLLIAIVLIVGAYFLSGRHLPSPSAANAESTQALLQAYAAKDTDSDGLPDWEEALYGTDPNNAHSVRADLTDGDAVAKGLATPRYSGQAVQDIATASSSVDIASTIPGLAAAPGSLTDQFSRLFFNNYMANRGDTPPSADQMQAFVQDAVTQLKQTRVRTDAFTASDVKVSGSGADALKTYVVQMEQAFKQHAAQTPYGASTYFSDAVERSDASALKNLKNIADSYTATAKALVLIPVPKEAAQSHLELANAMARVASTVGDLASVDTDPIRGMLGLSSYDDDSRAFVQAMISVGKVFDASGIVFTQGETGYGFYKSATALSQTADQIPTATTTP